MWQQYKKRKNLLILVGLYALTTSVSAISVVQQGNIIMQRTGQCEPGEGVVNSDGSVSENCYIKFLDPTFNSAAASRGIIKAGNIRFFSGLSSHTLSSETIPSLQKARYSLSASGSMSQLNYTSGTTQVASSASHPEGYYAIKDSIGLYWSAYLRYNGSTLSWGAVDSASHPWQACNVSDNFSRETGCGTGGGNTGGGNTGGGNTGGGNTGGGGAVKGFNSIFDGAGSLIHSKTVCYGCDKDIASMHPHTNETSTVVFQWRYDAQKCTALAVTAAGTTELPVLIQSKQWNDTTVKEAFKTTLSNSQPFYLEPAGEWTTFAATSLSPLSNIVGVNAECLSANQGRVSSVSSQAVSPSPVLVDNGAEWMGTGSVISSINKQDYGIQYDVTVGSNSGNGLSSFQWQTSQRCSNINVGDGLNIQTARNAIVSIKVWNEANFTAICNSVPCSINKAPNAYYVLKVESGAAEFPNGIAAICK